MLLASTDGWLLLPAMLVFPVRRPFQKPTYEYDITIIGAGASGLVAAGVASSVGFKTLLIERAQIDGGAPGRVEFNVGGDCTNAACVPSKAIRSIAKMAYASSSGNSTDHDDGHPNRSNKWLELARRQANDAVGRVRAREDPNRMVDVPNLELEFVKDCKFLSSHEMILKCFDNSTWIQGLNGTVSNAAATNVVEKVITSRKFLIATGASPVLPEKLTKAAEDTGVPYLTYRSLLRPNDFTSLLNTSAKDIVIIGGGATACELGQTLSRLSGNDVTLSIVAPTILPNEDVPLQDAAIKILCNDNCKLHLGRRAVDVILSDDGARLVMHDSSSIPVDCIIFCTGRRPGPSLRSLDLVKAGVAWTADRGVTVDSYLRSKSSRHVYASGDCASSVKSNDRRAIHAGWTGFNAARNALLPWFLRSPATHEFVPRVTYLDPEVASAGMSIAECTQCYGVDGYDSLRIREGGSDRADVESAERYTGASFVELRAEKITGRVLGASACGPAAAEIINEVCLSLCNKLTVRDIARTLHSYPSHGYLLYRITTALATQNISGLLSSCGLFGRLLGSQLRCVARVMRIFKFSWLPWKKHAMKKMSTWQATGSSNSLVMQSTDGQFSVLSFLDAFGNEALCERILNTDDKSLGILHGQRGFIDWVDAKDSL